ncbi:MAG TPA: TAT-variant-translocated molybdopterin oxidoreductase [Bryobacteraceae bacterium]|nr:TAT-variant-translocated molybdopterin oxidoreductase [Bryobacteraceae bacterium]
MIQITKKLTGKKYWRSLDQFYQTTEFQNWINREFPSEAAEMLDEPSRRNILKLMGASFALGGLTACRRPIENILPFSKNVEGFIHGKPLYYNTVMSLGGQAVGLSVETNEFRPTKIEGNPAHPWSLGSTKSYHQASVLSLYDDSRGVGVIGDGKASNWDAFTAYVKNLQGQLGNGAGLRFLSEPIHSPSFAAVKRHAMTRFPGAKWVEYSAVQTSATAHPTVPRIAFDKAAVVVALDSDFLGLDDTSVLAVKEFSRGRKITDEANPVMNRLYAVEPQFTVTGAAADHRFRLKASEIPNFATALLGALQAQSSPLQVLGQNNASKALSAIAKDLLANRGKAVVVTGPRQSAAVHQIVHQINQALGAVGPIVTYLPATTDQTRPQLDAMKELAGEMAAGQVNTLVMLGWNPVFTAPADLSFEANLKKVANTIYLAQDADETAAVSKWVVPAAHYLESWGDAVAVDGTASIQQPTIQPLWGGRTPAEIAALVSGYKDQHAYDIVRNHWLPIAGGEKGWKKALHDGLIRNATGAATTATASTTPTFHTSAPAPTPASGFEVIFAPSWSLFDGRFANNGWLQELPDPMTKLTWDNAAFISPASATKLGVIGGDVISIERNGRKLEAAVMIQPGQADDTILLPVGYGRAKVGAIGEGTGFNAYSIRTTDGFGYGTGFNVSKTGRTYPLARTQEFEYQEEPHLVNFQEVAVRPILREGTLDQYKKNPHFAEQMVEHPPLRSLYGDYDYSKGQQWAMTIDLNSCIGCNACMVACQAENNIGVVGKEQVARGREMHWIRIDRYYSGAIEEPQAVTAPVTCMQCETAPCENVCPVAATVHSPEGLNDMVYNRCVGTRYCSNNCPYKVRRFNFLNWHSNEHEVTRMVYNPEVTVRMRGVMEKCTYCVQRIQNAKIAAKAENRRWLKDGEVNVACAQACPSDCITFGNVNDPESRVAKTKLSPRNYAMLGELNTKPRTTYLAKLRNPNPELVSAAPAAEAHHG